MHTLLLQRALDQAEQGGARYVDARYVQRTDQRLSLRNGVVSLVDQAESAGIGVRVLVGNGWGFAATPHLTPQAVEQATRHALALARAAARRPAPAPIELGPPVRSQGHYTTPHQIDPFEVPLDQKVALLLAAEEAMRRVAGASVRQGHLAATREQRHFVNSEGADLTQTLYEVGGGLQVSAMGEDEVQRRSYPQGQGGRYVSGGWEEILRWDLPGQAERVASEAVALLQADPCPSGIETTLILGGDQLAYQLHESCGHAAELDRVFGEEAAFAGTSFLTLDKWRQGFPFGSAQVTILADAQAPLGLGSYGWDDEGIPAQSVPLVEAGRFVGYLMSRESAARLALPSNGFMRASGWNRLPLIRMANVNLAAGSGSLEALIADTDEGIYMETNRAWSIDERRYNFHFGTELGYEIKKGKRGRLLKNCGYHGMTPAFWNSCDAVCGPEEWTMWGIASCGKGQPLQVTRTGHGAAPARFRRVRVGEG